MRLIPFYSHTLWILGILDSCFIYKQWVKNPNPNPKILRHELIEGRGRHVPRFLFTGWVRVAGAILFQISYGCRVSTRDSYQYGNQSFGSICPCFIFVLFVSWVFIAYVLFFCLFSSSFSIKKKHKKSKNKIEKNCVKKNKKNLCKKRKRKKFFIQSSTNSVIVSLTTSRKVTRTVPKRPFLALKQSFLAASLSSGAF